MNLCLCKEKRKLFTQAHWFVEPYSFKIKNKRIFRIGSNKSMVESDKKSENVYNEK